MPKVLQLSVDCLLWSLRHHYDSANCLRQQGQPQQAVAFGEAILAAEWSKRPGAGRPARLTAANFEMGLRTLQPQTQQIAFDSLLPAGAKLPARAERTFPFQLGQTLLLLDIMRRSGEFTPLEPALRMFVEAP
jgi:hypothetical protein